MQFRTGPEPDGIKHTDSHSQLHTPSWLVRRLHTVRSESDLTASRFRKENEKPSNLTPTVQYEGLKPSDYSLHRGVLCMHQQRFIPSILKQKWHVNSQFGKTSFCTPRLNYLKEELHNRFNFISLEERVKIFKHNSENLTKIGWKIRKLWHFEVSQIFTKHFLTSWYEYANEWVDVITSLLAIYFVHKILKIVIFCPNLW